MVKVDPTPKVKCRFGVFCMFDLAFSDYPTFTEITEDSIKEMQARIANKIPSKLVQAYNLNKHIKAIEQTQFRRVTRSSSKMNVVENTNEESSPQTPVLKSKADSPTSTLQPRFDVTVHQKELKRPKIELCSRCSNMFNFLLESRSNLD